jgi:TonB family protein
VGGSDIISIRLRLLTLATALGLFLQPALAAAEDKPPEWVHRPTPYDLLAVYPRDALRRHTGGRAVITCTVSVQGVLRACSVLAESPEGLGFGAAAIALTPQFLMSPAIYHGARIESTITLPVRFQSGDAGGDPPTGSHIPSGISSQHAAHVSGTPQDTPGPAIAARVRWVDAPTYAQVVAAYPDKARAARLPGHATLDCSILATRRLGDCDVLSEVPAGLGFGMAAKGLAGYFLAPDSGSLAGARTQIAFTFAAEMLDAGARIVGKPEWSRLPEALDMAQAFPAAATAAHVAVGHVALSCVIEPAGMLKDCTVQRQSPEGLGFGDAALALSGLFQVSVWTDEGLPTVGGRVSVPIRYEAALPAPAADTARK